ncbi:MULTISPECIES: class I SAM-dependent methyltransferase [unclassified Rhodococcus (in: high G+C Gram-positive bacteria)]|uniref:class I SAM-dependent methyltransferase n=1 Tax=unclassified Rhodococcus (in: high G+C Gram-positive bacteria) TaxID=192944 RepID=UPI001C9A38C0|nr:MULTISPECIES: SAM-dependent methyltransferase [unclassified Rhodococcus (in: high G+C Gram-positive bacteria)]MBY6709134.1 class I SAM-dependent methyltransferase [Rhodococcus sp. BP-241]
MDVSSVGTTAVLTAQMRALESSRPDRLFQDDLAGQLVRATNTGINQITLEQVTGQRVYESLAVRTRWLDERFEQHVGIDNPLVQQIVLLGAGLDTRALRLGWLGRGVEVYEVDRGDVVDLKSRELRREHTEHWHGVTADLTDRGWVNDLLGSGFDATVATLWLAEGLFMYLSEVDNQSLLRDVEHLSAPGSHLLAVHFGRGALIDAETQAMSAAVASNGYGFESAIETSPQQWLGSRWGVDTALSIAQYAPALGRKLPYDEVALGAELTWMVDAEYRPR